MTRISYFVPKHPLYASVHLSFLDELTSISLFDAFANFGTKAIIFMNQSERLVYGRFFGIHFVLTLVTKTLSVKRYRSLSLDLCRGMRAFLLSGAWGSMRKSHTERFTSPGARTSMRA